MGRSGRMFRSGECAERLFCFLRNKRVEADDRILRRKLIVGELDRAILVQHRLETISRLGPSKVLDVAIGLGHLPGHYHSIRKLFDVAVARQARLEKDANRRNGVDQVSRRFAQRVEASNRNATLITRRPAAKTKTWRMIGLTETNRSGNTDRKRIPTLPGKRKRKIVHRHVRTGDSLTKFRVPLKRQVFDAVSVSRGREANAVPAEVKQVFAAECALIELHQDQVADHGDVANGLAGLLAFLSTRGDGRK